MQDAARLVFPSYQFGLHEPDFALRLTDLGVGGFCLYGGGVDEIAAFTERLQKRAAKPLLFCADYEDGLASHVGGGTALPSNMGVGASGSEEVAYRKGAITGAESRAIGVRWVFAPVVDLASEPMNPIVNTRAFGGDGALVTRMARAYLRGLKDEGVLGCVKHFPGHGRTVKDSHLDLPVIKASRAELEADLAPFSALAKEAGSVMTAHLVVPALEKDKKIPYSLSADVNATLRSKLGFDGLVTTDALNMKAISERFEELEAGKRALLGGADLLLVPAKPEELVGALVDAAAEDAGLAKSCERSLQRLCRALSSLKNLPSVGSAGVDTADHRREAAELAAKCLAWPRAPEKPLPAKILYWEPDADSADEWQGAAFVDALREGGVQVEACDGKPAGKGDTLVLGCFLSPRAYTGEISYDEELAAKASKLLKAAGRALIVSFGSPFVFEALPAGGLCAFARSVHAQKAAAAALRGKSPVTGLMPVPLRRAR